MSPYDMHQTSSVNTSSTLTNNNNNNNNTINANAINANIASAHRSMLHTSTSLPSLATSDHSSDDESDNENQWHHTSSDNSVSSVATNMDIHISDDKQGSLLSSIATPIAIGTSRRHHSHVYPPPSPSPSDALHHHQLRRNNNVPTLQSAPTFGSMKGASITSNRSAPSSPVPSSSSSPSSLPLPSWFTRRVHNNNRTTRSAPSGVGAGAGAGAGSSSSVPHSHDNKPSSSSSSSSLPYWQRCGRAAIKSVGGRLPQSFRARVRGGTRAAARAAMLVFFVMWAIHFHLTAQTRKPAQLHDARDKRRKSLADTLFSTLASAAATPPTAPSSPTPSSATSSDSNRSSSSSSSSSSRSSSSSAASPSSASSSSWSPSPSPLPIPSSTNTTPCASPRSGSPTRSSNALPLSIWSPTDNHYATLGVEPTASAADIKLAHRALALKYHPDKSTESDAAAKFIIVQDAFAVLSDPDKRRSYDRAAAAARRRSTSSSSSSSPSWWNIWQQEASLWGSRDMRSDNESYAAYSSTLRDTLEGLAAEIRDMSLAALAFFLTAFAIFLACALPLLCIVLCTTLSISISTTIMKAIAADIARRRARIYARATATATPTPAASTSSATPSSSSSSSRRPPSSNNPRASSPAA